MRVERGDELESLWRVAEEILQVLCSCVAGQGIGVGDYLDERVFVDGEELC